MVNNFILKIGQEEIHTKTGLIQGSVPSPILFNIFINDLLWGFESKQIMTIAYADDIICICKSKDQTKEAINIIKNWWSENWMKINEKKSGILRKLKRKVKTGVINNSLNIPEVKNYKFLGVVINQSITMNDHSAIIKSKVLSIFAANIELNNLNRKVENGAFAFNSRLRLNY